MKNGLFHDILFFKKVPVHKDESLRACCKSLFRVSRGCSGFSADSFFSLSCMGFDGSIRSSLSVSNGKYFLGSKLLRSLDGSTDASRVLWRQIHDGQLGHWERSKAGHLLFRHASRQALWTGWCIGAIGLGQSERSIAGHLGQYDTLSGGHLVFKQSARHVLCVSFEVDGQRDTSSGGHLGQCDKSSGGHLVLRQSARHVLCPSFEINGQRDASKGGHLVLRQSSRHIRWGCEEVDEGHNARSKGGHFVFRQSCRHTWWGCDAIDDGHRDRSNGGHFVARQSFRQTSWVCVAGDEGHRDLSIGGHFVERQLSRHIFCAFVCSFIWHFCVRLLKSSVKYASKRFHNPMVASTLTLIFFKSSEAKIERSNLSRLVFMEEKSSFSSFKSPWQVQSGQLTWFLVSIQASSLVVRLEKSTGDAPLDDLEFWQRRSSSLKTSFSLSNTEMLVT